jgi:hypothetical protein
MNPMKMSWHSTFWGLPTALPTAAIVVCIAALGSGCTQTTAQTYDATATATYTWQVTYRNASSNADRPRDYRIEKFNSVTLVNTNGWRPEGALTQDDAGNWWPALPPKPTVYDIEGRQKPDEQAEPAELIKSVTYAVQFDKAGSRVNLPTSYEVYRQVVKARPKELPLKFVLGPNDASVINAEP